MIAASSQGAGAPHSAALRDPLAHGLRLAAGAFGEGDLIGECCVLQHLPARRAVSAMAHPTPPRIRCGQVQEPDAIDQLLVSLAVQRATSRVLWRPRPETRQKAVPAVSDRLHKGHASQSRPDDLKKSHRKRRDGLWLRSPAENRGQCGAGGRGWAARPTRLALTRSRRQFRLPPPARSDYTTPWRPLSVPHCLCRCSSRSS